jgi:hypothetical protein
MRALLLFLFIGLPLAGLTSTASANEPKPVSIYLSDRSCCGHARLPPNMVPHSGVDFSGKFGDDVIAPADGVAMAHRGADPVGACPIVHLELSTQSRSYPAAQPGITFNAMDYMAGCFDPQKTYPDDKLVLTYPVRCKN